MRLRSLLRRPARNVLDISSRELARLSRGSDHEQQLGRALSTVGEDHLASDERHLLDLVEQRRRDLLEDDSPMRRKRQESTVADFTGGVSSPRESALVLFRLVRAYAPTTALELGSAVGISGSYLASALKLNGSGSLITAEGGEARVEVARETFAGLGLDNVEVVQGKFKATLGGILEGRRFGYAFIDGHHQHEPTLDYFDQITRHLEPTAVVVLDDIRWSEGMTQAWNQVREDDRVIARADLGRLGVLVMRG